MAKTRKELEAIASPMYLASLCERAGLKSSGSKAELIDRLLEAEGQVSEPEPEPEPAEPSEPEP